jgi:hypothetical protein
MRQSIRIKGMLVAKGTAILACMLILPAFELLGTVSLAQVAEETTHSTIAQVRQGTSISSALVGKPTEFWAAFMSEFYGAYDKTKKCWTSKYQGKDYCMRPHKLDVVGAEGNKWLFAAIGGEQLDENGEPVSCHACSGAMGLFVLSEAGSTLGIVAKNGLYEDFGSWSTVPDADQVAVRRLGPGGSYGWVISTGETHFGKTTGYYNLYGVVGDAIVSLGTIPAHFDDQGSCDNKRCSDYSFELIVDASSGDQLFYPLVLRASGERKGRLFNNTYRLAFDKSSLRYRIPPDLPQEVKPFR